MARLAHARSQGGLSTSECFGDILKGWRRQRGLSQFQLALEAEVSPRHLSFLETGRARPSREMVSRLLEALDVPLRGRNSLFLAAGFAPPFSEATFSEERMRPFRRIVDQLLERHDPYPAYAMDGDWNVVAGNRTHQAFLRSLVPEMEAGPVNILRLLFSPDQLRPHVIRWEDVARAVLRRVLAQVQGPHRSEGLLATLEEISSWPGVATLLPPTSLVASDQLIIPLGLRLGPHEVRFVTTLLTFGAALDVTLSELVVECFFPADEATERFVQGLGSPASAIE
ncbi:MAG: helix-turn-helix transcriptional regulator [Acidobacteria bacterium]|nr:helix-turn-helix transcriptional regulator [Acidobacteriota bacterium]